VDLFIVSPDESYFCATHETGYVSETPGSARGLFREVNFVVRVSARAPAHRICVVAHKVEVSYSGRLDPRR
jgi:hypothetical protein